MLNWYKVRNKGEKATDVYIYDEISIYGITAESFISDISDVKTPVINLHLNTPGGYVFDGFAIYNALQQHKSKVVVHIDGLAASAGSIIAMAGDEVKMAANAFLMIHRPWSMVIGNASDMRNEAKVLDNIGGSLIDTYVKKTGLDHKVITDWLADETWFNADEALKHGFVDAVVDDKEIENKHNLNDFGNVPEQAKEYHDDKPTLRMAEQALREAGFSRAASKSILTGANRREAEGDDCLDLVNVIYSAKRRLKNG
ncbi:MAG: Clp protease ClpP [FCB group bacterium]|nr:Clp protease ClpP [FCB group bacterium]